MQINEYNLNAFRQDFEEAMKSLASKYEIEIQMKTVKYNDNGFHFTCQAFNDSRDDYYREEFMNIAKYYRLNPDIIGQEVVIDNIRLTVLGVNPKSRKYPVACKDSCNRYIGCSWGALQETSQFRKTHPHYQDETWEGWTKIR